MKKGINCWTFEKGTPLVEAAKAAQAAGFETIEPTVEPKGELTCQTDEATCRKLADDIRATGLEISSLASGLFWSSSMTSLEAAVRQQAHDIVVAMLDRARWMGAGAILVVPGMVSHFEKRALEVPYAEALRYAYDGLRALVEEAEARGVVIAIENVWNQFLVSPVEMRDLIDRVNSSWVGAYLDTGNVLRYGITHDWIDTLGRRIVRVHMKDFDLDIGNIEGFCPLGEGNVDWPATMAALKRINYDNALTYEGPGDLKDIRQRIEKVMNA